MRPVAALLALLAAVVPAGCGTEEPAAPSRQRSFNQADVDFAVAMQAHHQDALTLTERAEAEATDPRVRRLADDIAAAQGAEVDRMARWLRTWSKRGGRLPGHGDGGHGGGMDPHALADLEQASGAAFDRRWLRLMVRHHEDAVKMAGEHRAAGRHPGARRMAADIVRSQRREIRTMRELLAGL